MLFIIVRKRRLQSLWRGDECRRWLEGIVQPQPQVAVDEQLLAQQCRQIGHGSDETSLALQILNQQHGNERGLDPEFQAIAGVPAKIFTLRLCLKRCRVKADAVAKLTPGPFPVFPRTVDDLPPYSPELNPIDRVSELARRQCFDNRCFPALEEVVAVVETQIENWRNGNDILPYIHNQ
jgi:hypothetical protein